MRGNLKRLFTRLALSAAIAGASLSAHAATFDAFADGFLQVKGSDALAINFETDTDFESFEDGTGVSNGDAMAGLTQAISSANGSATSFGEADASADSFTFVTVSNTSVSDAAVANVLFEYDLEVSASTTGAPNEEAAAEALVSLIGGSIDESFSLFATTEDGDAQDLLSQSLELQLSLAPGESITLELNAFAAGFAAAVPLPPALLLMLSAMGGLAVVSRKRREPA